MIEPAVVLVLSVEKKDLKPLNVAEVFYYGRHLSLREELSLLNPMKAITCITLAWLLGRAWRNYREARRTERKSATVSLGAH